MLCKSWGCCRGKCWRGPGRKIKTRGGAPAGGTGDASWLEGGGSGGAWAGGEWAGGALLALDGGAGKGTKGGGGQQAIGLTLGVAREAAKRSSSPNSQTSCPTPARRCTLGPPQEPRSEALHGVGQGSKPTQIRYAAGECSRRRSAARNHTMSSSSG